MKNFVINLSANIREAIKKLDKIGNGFVFIVDDQEHVKAILTDGDFRRGILEGVSLENSCISIANKDFKYVESGFAEREVINCFLKSKIQNLPVLEKGKLVNILYRMDFELSNKIILSDKKNEITAVIMAGGKGTRMKPFTNVLPKPLIPIGDDSMLEVIMDEYNRFFDCKFFISVNYKASMIKAYLEEFKDIYNISYIDEDKPLGTGGALKFLENKLENPFVVSNCDIIIKSNYANIYNSHIEKEYDITVVASMIHHKVPYGVCDINNGGELKKLVEKPEYDFLVNAGMYIISPETLKYIPENTFYNITDLINKVKLMGGKVGVFPVSEKSYLDAGQWKEYGDMLDMLEK